MPTLDFTDVIEDGDIGDSFSVIRRVETVLDTGRVVVTPVRHDDLFGSVVPGDPNDLLREDGSQMQGMGLSVITKFRVRGAGVGHQPDIIEHRGVQYIVKKVVPWTHFGSGFVLAVAELPDAAAPAPL